LQTGNYALKIYCSHIIFQQLYWIYHWSLAISTYKWLP